ncbi:MULTISPECIES: site-specific integrase [Actinosynnema]|uniref:tyrosine-type recombinase/integrase n=1 Tax=Actinosynnema TaxID=40566 RepID=UPI0020A5EDFD|nr:site-specific integrase [Actinosynnema pretiosum]MCP2099825.1 Site-specific recombinase XerD [Actinosynnema pretiosum]MCP2099973.1 Site-specific recombinase XerD [Actinosynnema pretiosum]
MATIEQRARKDGSVAYRLKWRFGGGRDGAPQSRTYDDRADAKSMKGAVEALGHRVYDTDPRVITFELVTGQRPNNYSGATFDEEVERYITSRRRASATSRDLYRRTLRRAAPLFHRSVESITTEDIQNVLDGLTRAGESAHLLADLLGGLFKDSAARHDYPNPMLGVQRPDKRPRTGNFLTSKDAALLVAACYALPRTGARLGVLVEVLLATGLRISEALGLTVADVDVDDLGRVTIAVELQLERQRKGQAIGARVPLKTRASHRRIAVDPDTAELLVRLIHGRPHNAPLFTCPGTGKWWSHQAVGYAFRKARAAAKSAGMVRTPRIHDLRHTHGSWLLADGIPLLVVSRRLGHESITITANTYGHVMPEADDAIRAVMATRRANLSERVAGVVVPITGAATGTSSKRSKAKGRGKAAQAA